ncbi:MAG: hypothetical protein KGD63_05935 [Candidatus Lokiarchaeota archaeon]|nr:hypothetical protein [Candidatus Lokiarchaeota archaeon]
MYWQNEITGQMKDIVMKFLDKQILNSSELKTLKWYIIQWIDNTKLTTIELKNEIDKELIDYIKISSELSNRTISLSQNEIYNFIVKDLLDFGIDPF